MSLARNTMFALLMAIEKDLGNGVGRAFAGEGTPLIPAEEESALARWQRDRDAAEPPKVWRHLWDYLMLGEKLDVLVRHRVKVAESVGVDSSGLKNVHQELTALIGVRNRVCHNRPPEPEDLPNTMDTTQRLLKEQRFPFDELALEFDRLNEKNTYPFTLSIPAFWIADVTTVHNNLPLPEWEETGYIGRDSDRRSLAKLILGSHPVINVTGEGGVGKTALITRSLYDLLDMTDQPYEAIVWTSLKADRLSASGVQAILGAMASEVDVLRAVVDRFGGLDPEIATDDLFEQVRNVLSHVPTLLTIDNIETIDRDALRPLLVNIPSGSKVVLTSRIGIGEIEVRLPLQPMEPNDAVNLFRRTALLFGVEALYSRDTETLQKYCERLYFNPLAIRWFIQGFLGGKSVNALVSSRRSQEALLDYCFRNVFEAFSEDQLRILRALVAAPGPLSEVQIALLAEIPDVEIVRQSIEYLASSNVVKRTHDTWGTRVQAMLWMPTSFARRYVQDDQLIKRDRPKIAKAYRALMSARRVADQSGGPVDYRPTAIQVSSTDEAIVARSLTQALAAAFEKRFGPAFDAVEKARNLLPDFHETFRVSAQVREMAGDNAGAREDFEIARDRCSDRLNRPLGLFYAQFLRRQGDPYTALTVLEPLAEGGNVDLVIAAELTSCYLQAGEWAPAFEYLAQVEQGFEGADIEGQVSAVGGLLTTLGDALDSLDPNGEERALPSATLRLLARGAGYLSRDPGFAGVAQVAFRKACTVMATSCDLDAWKVIAADATRVGKLAPLVGTETEEFADLETKCPSITQTDSYKLLTGRVRAGAAQGPRRGNRVLGRLKRFPAGGDYTFIAGRDGSDYFLHRAQLSSRVRWDELFDRDDLVVEFTPGPRPLKGSAKALDVVVLVSEPA